MRRIAFAGVFLLVLVRCSLAQNPKALTTFDPTRDFFRVANEDSLGWNGVCLGIAESSVAYFGEVSRNGTLPHLHDVERKIKYDRGVSEGTLFLREVNQFAHNYSNSVLQAAPRSGYRVADLMVQELTRTHQPQVLGLDLAGGQRHAVVIYDAREVAGKVIFKLGDPNRPDRNNLEVVYDRQTNSWADPTGTFQNGFTPVFVRWDERTQRPGSPPDGKKLVDLIRTAQEPNISPESLRVRLRIPITAESTAPATINDLTRFGITDGVLALLAERRWLAGWQKALELRKLDLKARVERFNSNPVDANVLGDLKRAQAGLNQEIISYNRAFDTLNARRNSASGSLFNALETLPFVWPW